MQRLVAGRVARGMVWAGGGGRHGWVRGLAMGFPWAVAGGGVCRWVRRREVGMVGVGGGLRVVCRCSGPGGGARVWGRQCWGWGRALCWWGVRVSRRVLCVVCVRVRRVPRPLARRSVGVGGGCLGFQVGLRFVGGGRLLVGGARR